MTDQELNRAVQYVTASTSYGRDTVAEILKTGLGEMTSLAMQSSERFERDVLLNMSANGPSNARANRNRWSGRSLAAQAAGSMKCTRKSPGASRKPSASHPMMTTKGRSRFSRMLKMSASRGGPGALLARRTRSDGKTDDLLCLAQMRGSQKDGKPSRPPALRNAHIKCARSTRAIEIDQATLENEMGVGRRAQ